MRIVNVIVAPHVAPWNITQHYIYIYIHKCMLENICLMRWCLISGQISSRSWCCCWCIYTCWMGRMRDRSSSVSRLTTPIIQQPRNAPGAEAFIMQSAPSQSAVPHTHTHSEYTCGYTRAKEKRSSLILRLLDMLQRKKVPHAYRIYVYTVCLVVVSFFKFIVWMCVYVCVGLCA